MERKLLAAYLEFVGSHYAAACIANLKNINALNKISNIYRNS